MKNVLIVLGLLVIALLLFSGLNPKENNNLTDDKIVALSTFTIIADMVHNVGGDKIESISLTKPGAEIHGYQPTPEDLIRASRGDVLFENGMGLELWTDKLRASLPDVPVVSVSTGVQVIDITEDAYAGKPNPHAWMSPKQGLIYVENIRRELTKLAPEHEAYFQTNADHYSEEIKAVDLKLKTALSPLPANNRILVTCEGAFSYLTNDYDLEEVYLWAINSESQGSPRQVARVIDLVREKNIPAVFCESTVAPKVQQEVVAATDAILGGVLYVDSLSPADGPASTYLSLLQHTAKVINAGLTGQE